MKSAIFMFLLIVLAAASGAQAQSETAEQSSTSPQAEAKTTPALETPTPADSAESTTEKAKASEAIDKDKSTYVICRNDKLVRTIRVDLKKGVCKAIYTKNGQDDIVGRSGAPDICYSVVNKIRTNLEKTVWKCKDVNPDRVSFTLE